MKIHHHVNGVLGCDGCFDYSRDKGVAHRFEASWFSDVNSPDFTSQVLKENKLRCLKRIIWSYCSVERKQVKMSEDDYMV
ncbi:hypothetical protein HanPI659440_Chr04g0168761 [Helianthus annuus]|nr:hypothetical protein HanPI659440_Chr04g0168761 [Helianthus annuus]